MHIPKKHHNEVLRSGGSEARKSAFVLVTAIRPEAATTLRWSLIFNKPSKEKDGRHPASVLLWLGGGEEILQLTIPETKPPERRGSLRWVSSGDGLTYQESVPAVAAHHPHALRLDGQSRLSGLLLGDDHHRAQVDCASAVLVSGEDEDT